MEAVIHQSMGQQSDSGTPVGINTISFRANQTVSTVKKLLNEIIASFLIILKPAEKSTIKIKISVELREFKGFSSPFHILCSRFRRQNKISLKACLALIVRAQRL
jgi:hypothetical protein